MSLAIGFSDSPDLVEERPLLDHPLYRVLVAVTALGILVSLYLAFSFTPKMGKEFGYDAQRIFYFHVPSAWTAFLAFGVVALAGVLYLRTRKMMWDVIARSSAEIGVLFTTTALVSGSLWAKPVWGSFWTWDPRLTTTALLWLIYVSYLLLRSAIPEMERRATFGAIVGIVGFIDVPIVFMSIRWWRTIHPDVVGPGHMNLEPSMVVALMVSLLSFTLLYVTLMVARVHLEESSDRLERAKRMLGLYGRSDFNG